MVCKETSEARCSGANGRLHANMRHPIEPISFDRKGLDLHVRRTKPEDRCWEESRQLDLTHSYVGLSHEYSEPIGSNKPRIGNRHTSIHQGVSERLVEYVVCRTGLKASPRSFPKH
jgi:hypothetical protein